MPLTRLAELYGVATSYAPSPDRTVTVPEAAVVAALAALGVDASTPEAVRSALTARETELITRLLPPTVVWWQGHEPWAFADLPPGTRLRVETEQGATHAWTTPKAGSRRRPPAHAGAREPAREAREPDGERARQPAAGEAGAPAPAPAREPEGARARRPEAEQARRPEGGRAQEPDREPGRETAQGPEAEQPEPDGQPESGAQPESDGRPGPGGQPEAGAQPESDGQAGPGGQSGPGAQPESDRKPGPGEQPAPDEQPGPGTQPESGGQSGPGEQPERGERPDPGERPEPGAQPASGAIADVPPPLPPGVHTLTATAPDRRTARVHLVVAPARMPDIGAAPAPSGQVSTGSGSGSDSGAAGGRAGAVVEGPAPAPEAGPRPGHAVPRPARVHGLLVQLYSVLSERSWGMGDLGDLAELAAWAGRACGTGFVQVNPLHSGVPGVPGDPSPYRPSSRYVPDPVHLRVEDVPEYAYLDAEARATVDGLARRAAQLRAAVLHDGALIDRDAVWALKREALEAVGRVPLDPGRQAAYADFLADAGQALEDHATWCALAEVHGPDWSEWPEELRDPRSAATARARRTLLDRVDFHSRLAWLTDGQLAAAQRAARAAGMPVGIVHDLAIGVHPSGADAWAQQNHLARGMSLGAPPDAFNPRGQDWGLPPWRPDRLAASGYDPYRRLLRALFRSAGGLRIDHVMGLFRLWWIPQGEEPTAGTYVHYDSEAMLAVLALEAHRAGAIVIGEDLGTVAPGVRETLRAHGVLGTSVLWFERTTGDDTAGEVSDADADADAAAAADGSGAGRPLPPERWRPDCLATLTTHDLPPTAARLTGADVALRHRLGLLTRPLEDERNAAATEIAEWLELLARLGLLYEDTDDALFRAAETTTITEAPETPETPETTEASETTGVSEAPEASATSETPGVSETPGDGAGVAGGPEPADRPAVTGAIRAHGHPGQIENPETFQFAGEEERIRALYRFLARTPARLIGVWLPDGVGDRRPQNVPGTWQEYPNWRLPVADPAGRPLTLEQLTASPRLHGLLAVLRQVG